MKGLNVPDKTASEKFSKQRESMAHAKKKKKRHLKAENCKIFIWLLSSSLGLLILF